MPPYNRTTLHRIASSPQSPFVTVPTSNSEPFSATSVSPGDAYCPAFVRLARAAGSDHKPQMHAQKRRSQASPRAAAHAKGKKMKANHIMARVSLERY